MRHREADGFFLNLATELVGIVVTVAYVDWVLRVHEEEKWAGTEKRIENRLTAHATLTITAIRTSFGFGPEIINFAEMDSNDLNRPKREMARVADALAPAVRDRLDQFNQAGWEASCGGA